MTESKRRHNNEEMQMIGDAGETGERRGHPGN
jgi:hypothetical protein